MKSRKGGRRRASPPDRSESRAPRTSGLGLRRFCAHLLHASLAVTQCLGWVPWALGPWGLPATDRVAASGTTISSPLSWPLHSAAQVRRSCRSGPGRRLEFQRDTCTATAASTQSDVSKSYRPPSSESQDEQPLSWTLKMRDLSRQSLAGGERLGSGRGRTWVPVPVLARLACFACLLACLLACVLRRPLSAPRACPGQLSSSHPPFILSVMFQSCVSSPI